MELTPYQTHASIALIGFGVSAGMAANVPLAAGCFGGLGALHLFLLVRLAIADWLYIWHYRDRPPHERKWVSVITSPRYRKAEDGTYHLVRDDR